MENIENKIVHKDEFAVIGFLSLYVSWAKEEASPKILNFFESNKLRLEKMYDIFGEYNVYQDTTDAGEVISYFMAAANYTGDIDVSDLTYSNIPEKYKKYDIPKRDEFYNAKMNIIFKESDWLIIPNNLDLSKPLSTQLSFDRFKDLVPTNSRYEKNPNISGMIDHFDTKNKKFDELWIPVIKL